MEIRGRGWWIGRVGRCRPEAEGGVERVEGEVVEGIHAKEVEEE